MEIIRLTHYFLTSACTYVHTYSDKRETSGEDLVRYVQCLAHTLYFSSASFRHPAKALGEREICSESHGDVCQSGNIFQNPI